MDTTIRNLDAKAYRALKARASLDANFVGLAYAFKGMYPRAESAFKAYDARSPAQAGKNLALGWLYALTGAVRKP